MQNIVTIPTAYNRLVAINGKLVGFGTGVLNFFRKWQRHASPISVENVRVPSLLKEENKLSVLSSSEILESAGRFDSKIVPFLSIWKTKLPNSDYCCESILNYEGEKPIDSTVRTSKLKNGISLASKEAYGEGCSVSLYVNAGSVREDDNTIAASHFLQHLAFKGRESHSGRKLAEILEENGCTVNCTRSREHLIYSLDVPRKNLDGVLRIVSGMLRDDISDSDVELARLSVLEDLDSLDDDELVLESLHNLMFGGNSGLEKPMLCSRERVKSITADEIGRFRDSCFVGSAITISSSGIPHHAFVNMAVKAGFQEIELGSLVGKMKPSIQGGFEFVESKRISPFSTVGVAFEGSTWTDKEFFTICVLQVLLGGGGSFSSGGPGKGMHSRMYRNVLNQHVWVDSARSFAQFYSNSGLFGFTGSCESHRTDDLIQILVNQLLDVAGLNGKSQALEYEEVQRAKTQLKSSWLMGMESRMVASEDIGRQVQVSGNYQSLESLLQSIDRVSADDLILAARKILKGWSNENFRPAIVVCGQPSDK